MASTAPLPRRLGFVPGLDGLRGVAVLLVMMSHLQAVVGRIDITGIGVVDGFIDGGYLGVDLFFVLSGFLITSLLLAEHGTTGRVRFGSFYARRALRLLPALYFMLLCHAFYTLVADFDRAAEWDSIRSAVLYVSNWQVANELFTVATGTNHLWSLAIEEQFYLVWPLVLLTCLGWNRSTRTVVTVLLAAIGLIMIRRLMLLEDDLTWIELFVRTDTRADSLLVGALLGQLWVRGATPIRGVAEAAWAATAAGVVYIASVGAADSIGYQGGLTFFAACAAVVILAVVNGDWSATRALEWPPLQAVGRVSYGLYLWHFPVFHAVRHHAADLPEVPRVLLALAITTFATLTSWYCLERPLQAIRRRLRPAPDGRPAAPVSG
jgi:peptidoglycan/LPS O-acetylase OafA/YrhL